MNSLIYLDNNATTKIDPRVLECMMPFLEEDYGNASSVHQFGLRIAKHVEEARIQIADLISADKDEIILTSGATESLNLGIKGFAFANRGNGNHIITVKTEHKAVLDTCKYLESVGFEVSYLSVDQTGMIDLEQLKKDIRKDTILVCVMLANNEIGVLQPLQEIIEIAHSAGVKVLTDATQAVGKINVNVKELGVDFLAFSGHKFYAPKGIGALYIRAQKRRETKLVPLIHGGGHENGMRSGTLNVPNIIGLGKACEIAMDEMQADYERIRVLRDKLEQNLLVIPNSFINGSTSNRMFNVSNICFRGIEASILIGKLKNIAISNGSACSSSTIEPSHVLQSIGLSYDEAMSSIRFSLGRFNTLDEVLTLSSIFQEQLKILTGLKYA